MTSPVPILYSYRRCPYAMRARMALRYSQIVVEIREITLKDKPASMLQRSPKGTVPVLVLATGEVIDESLNIMRWALAQHDPDNWRMTDNSDAISEMERLLIYNASILSWHWIVTNMRFVFRNIHRNFTVVKASCFYANWKLALKNTYICVGKPAPWGIWQFFRLSASLWR